MTFAVISVRVYNLGEQFSTINSESTRGNVNQLSTVGTTVEYVYHRNTVNARKSQVICYSDT